MKTESESKKNIFWNQKDDKVNIDLSLLREWLSSNGFYKFVTKEDYELVKITGKIVSRIKPFVIKDYIMQYCISQELPDVLSAFVEQHHFLTNNYLELLDTYNIEFHRDNKEAAYFYFKNGYVEVTASAYDIKDYDSLEGYIWVTQILDHHIQKSPGYESEFSSFVENISGKNRLY